MIIVDGRPDSNQDYNEILQDITYTLEDVELATPAMRTYAQSLVEGVLQRVKDGEGEVARIDLEITLDTVHHFDSKLCFIWHIFGIGAENCDEELTRNVDAAVDIIAGMLYRTTRKNYYSVVRNTQLVASFANRDNPSIVAIVTPDRKANKYTQRSYENNVTRYYWNIHQGCRSDGGDSFAKTGWELDTLESYNERNNRFQKVCFKYETKRVKEKELHNTLPELISLAHMTKNNVISASSRQYDCGAGAMNQFLESLDFGETASVYFRLTADKNSLLSHRLSTGSISVYRKIYSFGWESSQGIEELDTHNANMGEAAEWIAGVLHLSESESFSEKKIQAEIIIEMKGKEGEITVASSPILSGFIQKSSIFTPESPGLWEKCKDALYNYDLGIYKYLNLGAR